MSVPRYLVREPRNVHGELIGTPATRRAQPWHEVRDLATLVKTARLPFHEVPRLVASKLTYAEATEFAAQLNAQNQIDMAYAMHI